MKTENKLTEIRKKHQMSQSVLAQLLNTDQETIKLWEKGLLVPDIEILWKYANLFKVPLESFATEAAQKSIQKDFGAFSYWELYSSDLQAEFRQSLAEGLTVEPYQSLFEAVSNLPTGEFKERLADNLFQKVLNAEISPDYPYREPSDLKTIKELRRTKETRKQAVNYETLADKVRGAWFGRAAGCMLGKAVECIKSDELIPFLKETGNYPLHRYIYASDLTEEIIRKYRFDFSTREYVDRLDFMPSDDDMNYLVMAQQVVETCGLDFSSYDMAKAWLKYQTKDCYCTAEKVAYCNFIKGYYPPKSAIYKNPYREWIGAQIRGDYFGYINPGDPEKAAEMAYRDACLSHVKNGIYGEMFVAATLAIAGTTDRIEDIILGALAEIPATSRYYEAVMSVFQGYKEGKTFADTLKSIHKRFDEKTEYDWCHVLPNAMIVVAALLYGKGDFGKSICLAVESAFDTDCNGATVGSILGMALGFERIPPYWYQTFNNRLQTTIFGVETVDFSSCIGKTLRHIDWRIK